MPSCPGVSDFYVILSLFLPNYSCWDVEGNRMFLHLHVFWKWRRTGAIILWVIGYIQWCQHFKSEQKRMLSNHFINWEIKKKISPIWFSTDYTCNVIRIQGLRTQHLETVQPSWYPTWLDFSLASYLISLCFNFLISKMEIII